MTKRSAIILSLVFAFLLWGLGWPLLKVHLNRRTAAQDQQSLISSLKVQYPNFVFQPGDVAGYPSPRAHIRVMTPIEPAIRLEIRQFLEIEKVNGNFEVLIWLEFNAEKEELLESKR
jgi:hypothetical protein